MRREKPPGRQKGARLFSMLLAVCLMIAALPLSVSAAGEYVPGNPRWSGYQNQVQWDRPAGAASGDSFEYEAQLLLGDDVVNKTVPLILCAEENVEGTHGATIGALDDDTLFYFESRGFDRGAAEHLMARAAVERLAHALGDDATAEAVQHELNGGM